ncbi:CAAX protease self-immunity [Pseudonocardia ammonioxydans]|uniref:CAAX protease self-immunity n=1 Tax=Pseudonocardia ammonioxydans TaxID=260086 RepID=A0A1I5CUW5_PSUAM|nr:CPBP family intramembrane glutamic endopeptidase [Pseudonocardia ammonioxydans]SFN90738.1 CAAX protease self-immunity [Pseudonocardia ammonioxydans]
MSVVTHPATGSRTTRAGVDLTWFAVLTMLVSWVPLAMTIAVGRPGDVWFLVGTSGPTLAALLLWLAGHRRPRGPARPVLTRVWAWVPAALALGLLPSAAAVALAGPMFDPAAAATMIEDVGGLFPALMMLLLAGPLAEEFGWRGYAQPRLCRRLGPVATSAVLGAGWAVWHLPLFFVPGTSQAEMGIGSPAATLFLISFLPLSYLFWFVTERLSGGVAGAVLMHVALNTGVTFGGISSDAAMGVVLGTATLVSLAVAALGPRAASLTATARTPARPVR